MRRGESFCLLLAKRVMASWLLQGPGCHKGVSKALLTKNRTLEHRGPVYNKYLTGTMIIACVIWLKTTVYLDFGSAGWLGSSGLGQRG